MDALLEKKIASCPTLPTLPAVAVEVVAVCRRDDIEVRDVAALLEKDPALASKILRFANSVSIAARSKVTTLSRALTLLGTNTVLTLALSFSLVGGRKRGGGAGFDHAAFWRRALVSALGSRALASKRHLDREELFLAGLLQDLGMLALAEVFPAYGALVSAAGPDHAALAEAERHELGVEHAEVSAFLAESWKLPDLIVETARGSHDPAQAGGGQVFGEAARCVHVGGLLAETWAGAAPAAALAAAQRALDIAPPTLEAVLASMGAEMAQVAADFELQLHDSAEVEAVLERAKEALALLSARSEAEQRAAARAAEALAAENRSLEERSRRDVLTGVFNRAHVERTLAEAFDEASARRRPLSVAFCDLDHFKRVNDARGHATGDRVLAAVAQVIAHAARAQDAVGRWGGEEFVVVLPDTGPRAAQEVAERIRGAVEGAEVAAGDGAPLRVTLSVGHATHAPGTPFDAPAALVDAADACLYAAKRAGRNRVVGRP